MRKTWINVFFQQNFTTFDELKCKHWITPPRMNEKTRMD
jgi:hypothetical protein